MNSQEFVNAYRKFLKENSNQNELRKKKGIFTLTLNIMAFPFGNEGKYYKTVDKGH